MSISIMVRRLALSLLLLAVLAVTAMAIPVSAHVTSNVGHTWTHIEPKVQTLLANRFPWALVGPTGALIRGNGAASVTKPGTGTYVVTFSRDISTCSYSATSVDTVSGSSPVYARLEVGALNSLSANQVRVGIINSTSTTLVDFGFSLQVMC